MYDANNITIQLSQPKASTNSGSSISVLLPTSELYCNNCYGIKDQEVNVGDCLLFYGVDVSGVDEAHLE